ncbi:Hypothetical predicted protein [Olea europaea subsp. europaea]|uniref:Uncharacterized protein n=1 Tax=Olea europaea subsp. europaea TaxID=158383 RepID=A0A8S0TY35_OLEEU|nr:Hypothetical predicted protein [Olea europaea subsp. europaea]
MAPHYWSGACADPRRIVQLGFILTAHKPPGCTTTLHPTLTATTMTVASTNYVMMAAEREDLYGQACEEVGCRSENTSYDGPCYTNNPVQTRGHMAPHYWSGACADPRRIVQLGFILTAHKPPGCTTTLHPTLTATTMTVASTNYVMMAAEVIR